MRIINKDIVKKNLVVGETKVVDSVMCPGNDCTCAGKACKEKGTGVKEAKELYAK